MSRTWQEAKPVFKLSSAQLLSLWTITCLTPAQSASFNRDQGRGSQGTDTEMEAEQGLGTGSVALPQGTCVYSAFPGKGGCSVATLVPSLGLVCYSGARRAHPYKVRR